SWRGGGCSELRLCHCTPAWAKEKETDSKEQGELSFYFQNSKASMLTSFTWRQNKTF
uniref:Uncharacterized protein n=1 Tax=Macaca fascicularis TaxID=9541 RepID=A0A7N9IEH2_MACFA